MSKPLSLVVLISGRGSNLAAIIEAMQAGLLVEISCVISNVPEVLGLEVARGAGIATEVFDHRRYSSRIEFERELAVKLGDLDPDLIVLAGFMRRLGVDFVEQFRNRLLNIHPSLLPKYPGLDTYERALAAGDEFCGTTVHLVTEEVDSGPIIAQVAVPIVAGDTVAKLKDRVQQVEHRLYPAVLGALAAGELRIDQGRVWEGEQILTDFTGRWAQLVR